MRALVLLWAEQAGDKATNGEQDLQWPPDLVEPCSRDGYRNGATVSSELHSIHIIMLHAHSLLCSGWLLVWVKAEVLAHFSLYLTTALPSPKTQPRPKGPVMAPTTHHHKLHGSWLPSAVSMHGPYLLFLTQPRNSNVFWLFTFSLPTSLKRHFVYFLKFYHSHKNLTSRIHWCLSVYFMTTSAYYFLSNSLFLPTWT
jgi:hypothetical protein